MNAPARGGRVEVVYLVAAAACWGIGTVISKQAVAELPPLTLLVMQLASSVVFLAVLGRAGAPNTSPRTAERRILARLGLLNPGLAYALSLAGLSQITASLAVLLWATEPILILALASLVLGERLGLRVIVPTAIALGGLSLVVFDPAASGSTLGVALTVAGVVACAIYSVGVRRWLPGAADSTLDVVLGQQRYALGLAVVALAGLALAGHAIVPTPPSLFGVASAIASGLLYYALAYLCYLSAVRTMPVSVAAASFYLIPIFGVAGAWLAGERLQPIQWLGAILVVVSVAAITTLRQPSSAAASAQIAMTPSEASRR
jgi:drug/metabolite transporter (DMT)-like permease